jgi:hypothetical protein
MDTMIRRLARSPLTIQHTAIALLAIVAAWLG